MNYKITRKPNALLLQSGLLMNTGFLIPLILTFFYTLETPQISIWHLLLFLLFATGATYREKWVFKEDTTSFRLRVFFIPFIRKSFPTKEIEQISLKTFIRGENRNTVPGSDRKWFQIEQGILKLKRRGELQETLIMDTNRRNIHLQSMGDELASYLEIPFVLNP